MIEPKLFGIGFHKTGTSSLAAACTRLGYRVTGPNWVKRPTIAQDVHDLAFDLLEQFDAFQDNPWPLLYRELDAWCPGSRFILTVRDTDHWMRSVLRHFGETDTPMRRWIYGFGSPVGHEHVYRDRYEAHNAEVIEYFRNRPTDFLIMDITRGDAWQALCRFLGRRDVPEEPFPHVNRATRREWGKRKEALKKRIRRLLRLGG